MLHTRLIGQVEPQAIYDLVGDKITEVFHPNLVTIETFNNDYTLIHNHYIWKDTVRSTAIPPRPLGKWAKTLLETRQPIIVNNLTERKRFDPLISAPNGQLMTQSHSVLDVPMVAGEIVSGYVSLQSNHDDAFDDNALRLLQAMTNTMSIALENIRLLKETQQRNAELAVINAVGAALEKELDFQGIFDTVGDKLHDILKTDVVMISTYDPAMQMVHHRYAIEQTTGLWHDSGVCR
jgi:GAF domain-containing protein